ncbi:CoA-transferase family III [Plasmodiophora brassicae]|nr:hypothetical protein PBRA_007246 [Plasmodiophora brassicae]
MLPGPLASQILCDFGATVIRVEHPTASDSLRTFPMAPAPDHQPLAFHAINRGKQSVVLDLKTSDGKSTFLRLLQTADVLLESFRPGTLKNLGLDPAELHARFPRLIICSISGFGQTHRDRLRAGHDLTYLARVGALSLTKEPRVPPVQFTDIAGGSWPAVCQILAALYARDRTGAGSIIDVSMAHASRALLALALSDESGASYNGRFFLCGSLPNYQIYETADGGHVAVGALEPEYFRKLLAELGLPLDLANLNAASAAREALRETFLSRTTKEWDAFFEPRDVMCEIVRAPDDPVARSFDVNRVGVEIAGQTIHLPSPVAVPDGAAPRSTPGPVLGEHTEQILSSL